MTHRQTPRISSRKQPQQARSTELVAAILEAAVQVLAKEGARRFTTARVAEKAGVSVGSVYQYFPNKAAILFRLQSDEWRQTAGTLGGIIEDARKPPLERLRTLVHAFIRSECEEAAMRAALDAAAPLYRDAPEAREARASRYRTVGIFMQEALPGASAAVRGLAGDLIATTLSSAGKHFSGSPHTPAEIETYADAMADMFCAYVTDIEHRRDKHRGGSNPPLRVGKVNSGDLHEENISWRV
ncbi:MAG: TetR family transcriptional regulator [Candidatus Accumulibacter sp.]|jgi:AcrR family transcriptional regulator|nr:TetR family transcriptional regulator [Accumulibacter sp.]